MFEDPVHGIFALGCALQRAQDHARESGDKAAFDRVQMVEEAVIDRLKAVALNIPELCAEAQEWVPRASQHYQGDLAPVTLFDVAKKFARRVPLTKLITLESDVRPYLACIIVDALREADETIFLPEGYDKVEYLDPEEWEKYRATMASRQYQAYGALTRAHGSAPPVPPEGGMAKMRRDMQTMQQHLQQLMHHVHSMAQPPQQPPPQQYMGQPQPQY
jgi:hypothetical protein